MQDSLQYFLIAAEELNITRAAQRLFISQQCLSEHIQKLERKYNTKLFYRRPKLALTPSGQALVHSLQQIQVIENGLFAQLDESNANTCGSLSLAIIQTRAAILIPNILSAYREMYPNVQINITHGKTKELEELVVSGKADFFIGIRSLNLKELTYISLLEEKIYLVVSDRILDRYMGVTAQQRLEFEANGVTLDLFKNVPFVLNSMQESLRGVFNALTLGYTDEINVLLELDDPYGRSLLCARDCCATIFTESMCSYVTNVNSMLNYDGHLNAFYIKGSELAHYTSVIAYHKLAYIPKYRQAFIQLVTDFYTRP